MVPCFGSGYVKRKRAAVATQRAAVATIARDGFIALAVGRMTQDDGRPPEGRLTFGLRKHFVASMYASLRFTPPYFLFDRHEGLWVAIACHGTDTGPHRCHFDRMSDSPPFAPFERSQDLVLMPNATTGLNAVISSMAQMLTPADVVFSLDVG
jgi:hypothetical protein